MKWSGSFGRRGLAVLALLGLVGFGAAGCRRGHGDPAQREAHLTRRIDAMLDRIEADETQRQVVHGVRDRLFADLKALHADHDDLAAQVLAEWGSDRMNAATLHALVDRKLDEMRAAAHRAVDGAAEVHGALTPAQRKEIADHLEQRRSHRRHGGRGKHGGNHVEKR